MSMNDNELDREVDDLLSQLPSKPYQRPSILSGSGEAAIATGRRPASLSVPKVNVGRARGAPVSDLPHYAWPKTVLAWALLVALPFWPYGNACGGGLTAYTVVVAIMLLTSGWAAVAAWREGSWRAYLVVLVVALAGVAMLLQVGLPRMGYTATAASWNCQPASAAPATSPAVPAASGPAALPRFM